MDGKSSGIHDFTSLLSPDKKKLLSELPSKMEGIVRPASVGKLIKVTFTPSPIQSTSWSQSSGKAHLTKSFFAK